MKEILIHLESLLFMMQMILFNALIKKEFAEYCMNKVRTTKIFLKQMMILL